MWPVYERICRVFRASVDGQPLALGARTVVADEVRGLAAMTATVVELMTGVGSSLVRVDGSRLPIATLNALLGLPPAYRESKYKTAREWLAFWTNRSFHWQMLQRAEQALADGTATDVAAALLELAIWQNAVTALIAGQGVEDQADVFLRHWRERD